MRLVYETRAQYFYCIYNVILYSRFYWFRFIVKSFHILEESLSSKKITCRKEDYVSISDSNVNPLIIY